MIVSLPKSGAAAFIAASDSASCTKFGIFVLKCRILTGRPNRGSPAGCEPPSSSEFRGKDHTSTTPDFSLFIPSSSDSSCLNVTDFSDSSMTFWSISRSGKTTESLSSSDCRCSKAVSGSSCRPTSSNNFRESTALFTDWLSWCRRTNTLSELGNSSGWKSMGAAVVYGNRCRYDTKQINTNTAIPTSIHPRDNFTATIFQDRNSINILWNLSDLLVNDTSKAVKSSPNGKLLRQFNRRIDAFYNV